MKDETRIDLTLGDIRHTRRTIKRAKTALDNHRAELQRQNHMILWQESEEIGKILDLALNDLEM